MIKLEFTIDEEELADNLECSPVDADADLLDLTYFQMPTRFIINGENLFYFYFVDGRKTDPIGLDMPLIGFAKDGCEYIKVLRQKESIQYNFIHSNGYILFRNISDNKVVIYFSDNKEERTVDYDELLHAFEEFSERVKSFLRKRVPELMEHPYWGEWVKGIV